jgi:hypothetical protein
LHQHDSHNSIEDKMGGVVKRGMQWWIFSSLDTHISKWRSHNTWYKEKDLKRDYRMLKEVRMQSGVGWDESQFKLQAEPHLWENLEIVSLQFWPIKLNFCSHYYSTVVVTYFFNSCSHLVQESRDSNESFPLYESLGQLYEGNICTMLAGNILSSIVLTI